MIYLLFSFCSYVYNLGGKIMIYFQPWRISVFENLNGTVETSSHQQRFFCVKKRILTFLFFPGLWSLERHRFWWIFLHPLWRICSSNWINSANFGMHTYQNTNLKPPRYCMGWPSSTQKHGVSCSFLLPGTVGAMGSAQHLPEKRSESQNQRCYSISQNPWINGFSKRGSYAYARTVAEAYAFWRTTLSPKTFHEKKSNVLFQTSWSCIKTKYHQIYSEQQRHIWS